MQASTDALISQLTSQEKVEEQGVVLSATAEADSRTEIIDLRQDIALVENETLSSRRLIQPTQ